MENQTGSNQNFAVVILSILLFLSFGVIILLLVNRSSPASSPAAASVPSASLPALSPVPTAAVSSNTKIALDREYTFAITGQGGVRVGEFTFLIRDAGRTKEIDIAGGKAVAVSGRELLILNIELVNSGDFPASVTARNYLRLTVNNQDRQLAPEYHADPVDLQPQSSKNIRLGFNIAETDKDLVLRVGELQGEKDTIMLF